MKRIKTSRGLVVALAVILATNAVLLGAALWNRLGVPTSTLSLTEGELESVGNRLAAQERADSGLAFNLICHGTLQSPPNWEPESATETPWLDRDKLREIGFDVDLEPSEPGAERHYRNMLPRQAFVVLELDEQALQLWLAEQERASNQRASDRKSEYWIRGVNRFAGSRLFAIDVGLDADDLHRQYQDRNRFLIVPGVVVVTYRQIDGQSPALSGMIRYLLVQRIHVPSRLGAHLAGLAMSGERQTDRVAASRPRYRATVAFGRRYEPWLIDLEPLRTSPEPTAPSQSEAQPEGTPADTRQTDGQ